MLKDRLFVGAAGSSGPAAASMFAYMAGATFVLQRSYGLSPQALSYAFGANSLGIMAMSQLAGRLTRRRSSTRVLGLGKLNLTGAAALAVTVLAHLTLVFLVGSLLVRVSAVGLIFPPSNALALADYPGQAGTASSLLGLGQYVSAHWPRHWSASPVPRPPVPLGVVALGASVGASIVFATVVLPGRPGSG